MLDQLKEHAVWASAQDSETIINAIKIIEESAKKEGDSNDEWEFHFYIGYLYFNLKQWDTAITELEASLLGHPENPETYLLIGEARAALTNGLHKTCGIKRDYSKRALLAATRSMNPENWGSLKYALTTLASAATNVGPADDVEFAYRWLIKLEPQNAHLYEQLAHTVADKDLRESVELMEKAHALNPSVINHSELNTAKKALRGLASRVDPSLMARYPSTEEMSGDLVDVIEHQLTNGIPKISFIRPETRFFALGSCFAREIAKSLQDNGHSTFYFEVSEHVNSTFANRKMVEWALGVCTGQPKERLDELFAKLNITPELLREMWSRTDVLIYTLGVAPIFRDRITNEFIMPRSSAIDSRSLAELYQFKTTSVSENLENIQYIYDKLIALNPNIKFVLTVSPVPLRMTFEYPSALQADCISKSTLRVTAHEFTTKNPGSIYWPSFEVVRWIGGHVGPYFGIDDGAALHVGDNVVTAITESFVRHFS